MVDGVKGLFNKKNILIMFIFCTAKKTLNKKTVTVYCIAYCIIVHLYLELLLLGFRGSRKRDVRES